MKIIHLSDLHFGTEKDNIINKLLDSLNQAKPDLTIISGDFTQRAFTQEFQKTKDFLNNLPCPAFCVPGNHDIPAYNLIERFFEPYQKYQNFINKDLCPVYENEKIKLAGLNSARRALPHWNWANGTISAEQRARLDRFFYPPPNDTRWKICTFHHPIHKVDTMPLDVTVFGRKATLKKIQDLKIDLVLTGHVHHASITTLGNDTHQTVYLSASTALSNRTRDQENGFNLITLTKNTMTIDIYKLKNSNFENFETFERKKEN